MNGPRFSRFTRRDFVLAASGAALAGLASDIAFAGNPTGRPLHGLSSFGDLKYGPDYPHFDYASPEAPKGGTFAFATSNWLFNQNTQTFNTLNSYVLQGEAPPRMELCFDTLMAIAWDEPDAIYGSFAQSVTISPDRNRFRFELRPQARFHDSSPMTAHDVVFTLHLLKEKGHPDLALDLLHLERALADGDHAVELVFDGKQSGRVILSIAGAAPVLSKAWYSTHDFEAATLTPPLGSGPWRVGRFEPGLFIEYERVRDYWANDLPFARGLDHFDRLRIDFYSERQAAFEAFKKGEVTWREEFTSKTWATEYGFPAVIDGRVKKTEFPGEKRPSMQAWAVNVRRAKFADPRTRAAIGMLFDFDWTNRNLFFGSYTRSHSLFERSDLAASGLPSPEELVLLEPLRATLPAEVFGPAVLQISTDGSGSDRAVLRKAGQLFAEAGWRQKGGRLQDPSGAPLAIEILIESQVFERLLGPYMENLRRLGIDVSIRLVDPAQFQSRLENFDFDMAGMAFSFEANPTAETLRQFFHSDSVNRNGSNNYPGIADPAVDALIDAAQLAGDRASLVTAVRALDRVLRARHYWIPNWHSPTHRVAHWDMFGWRDPKPDYAFPVERLWWFDTNKAKAIGKA